MIASRLSRVIVVTSSFPSNDADPSGHFVQAHAAALARQGADVHVLAPFGAASHAPQQRPPLTIHPAGGSSLFGFPGAAARAAQNPLRLAGALAFAAGVRRKLRELAPFQRVVAHWIVPGAWPLLAGVDARLDVVAHGADVRLLVRSPAPLRIAIVRSLLARGARFQVVATHLLDTLAGSLPPALAARFRAASHVEPAPIDVPDVGEEAARLRGSLRLSPEERLAVCVGRLVPEKRYHLAIAAAACAGGRVRLAIIGDGPERARLQSMAAACGVRTISPGAGGALPRRQTLAWIAAADVLVHPSECEGAPTVVREARALGTPVVACAAGDLVRWASEDAGIAIVAPEAAAIARAILTADARREDQKQTCVSPLSVV